MLVESDEQQIVRLFEDGDRALIAADLPELSRIFADDYIQYDETGRASTKQDVLNKLKSGAIRYVSMISTGRHIRLLSSETAVVHGSEEDEVEQAGTLRAQRAAVHRVVRIALDMDDVGAGILGPVA